MRTGAGGTSACGGSPIAIAVVVFAHVLTGGLVAGIRAGFAYNTFPLMNGHLVPPEILLLEPVVEEFLLQHGDRAVRSSR